MPRLTPVTHMKNKNKVIDNLGGILLYQVQWEIQLSGREMTNPSTSRPVPPPPAAFLLRLSRKIKESHYLLAQGNIRETPLTTVPLDSISAEYLSVPISFLNI